MLRYFTLEKCIHVKVKRKAKILSTVLDSKYCTMTRVLKQPIIVLYFESENELKFYNLEASSLYNQLSLLTKDTIWESDKNTSKHNTKESQEVSSFLDGDHSAARNR